MSWRIDFKNDKPSDRDPSIGIQKQFLTSLLRVFDKQVELATRISKNELTEQDLFFLRSYCHRIPSFKGSDLNISRARG